MAFKRINEELSKAKIDLKDKKMLDLLVHDARLPASTIAKKIGLSRDGTSYRIERLTKLGVIQGHAAFPDYQKLGFMKFRLFILVSESDPDNKKALISYLCAHDNVVRVLEFHDRWDFEIYVIAKTVEKFNKFLEEFHSRFTDILIEEDFLTVLQNHQSSFMPTTFYPGKAGNAPYHMDQTDYLILQEIGANAREHYFRIGVRLRVDADTVRNRIKNMQKAGIIKRLSTVINISKLNYSFFVYLATMRYLSNAHDKKLQYLVEHKKNIIEMNKTIGSYDVLTYLAVENEQTLHTMIKQIKEQFASIIHSYITLIAYREHCFNPVPRVLIKEQA